MSESTDQKASRYLAEGRVAALLVDSSAMKGRFWVYGSDTDPYDVIFLDRWECNCPSRVLDCAHIKACKMITTFETKPNYRLGSGVDT